VGILIPHASNCLKRMPKQPEEKKTSNFFNTNLLEHFSHQGLNKKKTGFRAYIKSPAFGQFFDNASLGLKHTKTIL